MKFLYACGCICLCIYVRELCTWMCVWTCGTNGDMVSRGAVGCKRVVELDMSESVKKKYVFD